jgi:hypothetical protein
VVAARRRQGDRAMEPLVEVSVSGAADRPRLAELGVLT